MTIDTADLETALANLSDTAAVDFVARGMAAMSPELMRAISETETDLDDQRDRLDVVSAQLSAIAGLVAAKSYHRAGDMLGRVKAIDYQVKLQEEGMTLAELAVRGPAIRAEIVAKLAPLIQSATGLAAQIGADVTGQPSGMTPEGQMYDVARAAKAALEALVSRVEVYRNAVAGLS